MGKPSAQIRRNLEKEEIAELASTVENQATARLIAPILESQEKTAGLASTVGNQATVRRIVPTLESQESNQKAGM